MISLRQLKRMLIIDIFGISTLVLPVGLAKTAGIYGGAAIILGTIIEIIIVMIKIVINGKTNTKYANS